MNVSRGKRVLMLVENNPFPNDPRVRREARALIDAGYQVSVIAPARFGQPPREIIDGIRVYRFRAPVNRGGPQGYIWEYGYSIIATFLISLQILSRDGFDI